MNSTPGEDDRELARSAATRNEDDFQKLYFLHRDAIYSLCLRMTGNPCTAEDLTQDIFIRAWKKIGTFRGDSSFRTWLYRIGMNIILRNREKNGRKSEISFREDLPGAAAIDPVDQSETLMLQTAIAALPKRCRAVLVMHDIYRYKHAEIAGILGITENTSKAHLHKARNKLRKELTR